MYQDVYVFCEQRDGNVQNIAYELLGKARELADQLGQKVVAVLAGDQIGAQAQGLIAHGADRVILADRPILAEYSTKPYTDVMAKVIREFHPEIVLFGATSIGRDLAPSVSATVHTGLTADCTGLEIGDVQKNVSNAADRDLAEEKIRQLGTKVDRLDKSRAAQGKDGSEIQIVSVAYTYHDQLRMTRPAFGGNIIATIACLQHRPQMATVRPGVMQALEADPGRQGEILPLEIQPENNVEVLKTVKTAKAAGDIQDAKILVSAGRGVGGPEKLPMVEALAQTLEGDVACSRAVVDAGWLPKEKQVGQTGKTVRPELYVALGVSGAIQHVAGMEDSGYIVAINKEPSAPIFDVADLGIVGDLQTIVPKLTEAIARYKAGKIS